MIDSNREKKSRCSWCGIDPTYVAYHDEVWGVPVRDSKALFAKLILDGAQAGLSWITILRREQEYYRVFDGLDPEIMAHFDEDKINAMLQDPGIIRNRLKVESAVKNARAWVRMKDSGIDFAEYLWGFIEGTPLINYWQINDQVPASTPLAEQISKDLKKRGFSFVGPTIVYAYMQAVGMVNDHLTTCYRHAELL